MDPQVTEQTHLVPLSATVVIGVAGMIIGFLINGITFLAMFVTKKSCEACQLTCQNNMSTKFKLVEDKLNEVSISINTHSRDVRQLFKYHTKMYGVVLAMAIKMDIKTPKTTLPVMDMVETETEDE